MTAVAADGRSYALIRNATGAQISSNNGYAQNGAMMNTTFQLNPASNPMPDNAETTPHGSKPISSSTSITTSVTAALGLGVALAAAGCGRSFGSSSCSAGD